VPIEVKRIEKPQKTIILTRFRDAVRLNCNKYSVSRWQPKNTQYPELKALAPKYPDGTPIKDLPPEAYKNDYIKYVLSNPKAHEQLSAVINMLDDGESAALLCWCNLARQSEYSELFCHRILIGYYIMKHFPEVNVVFADGAEVPVWKSL
jgi:hypothetical protein